MRATTLAHHRRTRATATGLVTIAVIALSILGGGTALAANPNWVVGHGTDSSTTTPQPASGASSSAVAAGAEVGFFEWLKNADTSNISQLYLTANTDPAATVVGAKWTIKDAAQNVVRSGSCPATTPLACSFGALNSGNTVYVVAAFTTRSNLADGATQSVTFEFNTTGAAPGKNNSHGDAKQLTDSVLIAKNGDASGDFNFDQESLTVADDQKVTGKNPQATSVTVPGALVGAAVGDSPALQTPCNETLTQGFPAFFSCSLLTSLTSVVEAGNGKNFLSDTNNPRIKVIVTFNQAPNQLNGANPFAYHYWETLAFDANGNQITVPHAELITATCQLSGGLPNNTEPCLIVGNKQVTVWLRHNGPMRF
jgi:hypothetical protein